MDDVRVGRLLRALRRRPGWTQRELGARVGLSQQAISLIERGHSSKVAGTTLRRVFAALDARWEGTVTWRGGDLDRLVDAEHASVVTATVQLLRRFGWDVAVEVTYSEYGERGSIDILGSRDGGTFVVTVEVKGELTVLEATVRKLDEKSRLVARSIARQRFGKQPTVVGRLLVLPAVGSARRRVREYAPVLDAAYPDRGVDVRRWLRMPTGPLAGILFLPATNPRGGNSTEDALTGFGRRAAAWRGPISTRPDAEVRPSTTAVSERRVRRADPGATPARRVQCAASSGTARLSRHVANATGMADPPPHRAPPEGPATEGLGGTPLRPDEDHYRTRQEPATEPPEGPGISPAAEPRPWMVLGLVLLVAFLAMLGYAVILPLIS